jgi:hypothetical protein
MTERLHESVWVNQVAGINFAEDLRTPANLCGMEGRQGRAKPKSLCEPWEGQWEALKKQQRLSSKEGRRLQGMLEARGGRTDSRKHRKGERDHSSRNPPY